jgi:hypothetical protein
MQKLLAGTAGLLLTVLLGGCAAVNTPGLGEEAGNATLPSGARLLDSEQGECDGMVQVDPDTLEGEGESLDDMDDGDDMDDVDSEFFVESGQNATFELDEDGDDDVGWTCIGEDGDSDSHTMNCPDGTDYVRVTRADDGDDVLLECFSS